MSSSACKAAWAFDDGTGSNKCQYYNGSAVTTLDSNIIGDPGISTKSEYPVNMEARRMTRSGFYSHIVVLFFLCASTIQAAQQITATPGDEKWGDRKPTVSQGQLLWYDATDVWFYNGSTAVQLQATNAVNDPTFTLGSDSTPGHVIAAWRTGNMGTSWVSRDGVPPVPVTYTNPIDATKLMNLEAVVVDDGHVFMGLNTTDANANTIALVFKVNPVTGAATLIGGTPVFPAHPGRYSQIFTSEGKAVWLDDDGTNPLTLKYYDGRVLSSDGDYTTTVDTDATLLQPVISNGKIVYGKKVNGIAQVFVYDTTAVSPSPVQLTNYGLTSRNVGTNGGGILTDGRHVAWSWQTTAGNSRHIVMNGQVPMTDATNKLPDGGLPQSGGYFPFHLDRGQMAWLGIGGLRFADSSGISAVPLTPATTVQKPYLADGYLAWLGTATGQTNLDVFRYTASAPTATSPPLALTATAAPGQVTFAWDQILGASSYNVYMAQVSGVTKDNYASLTGGQRFANVTSPYAIPGLANGTYYFVVTAVEGGIEGPTSREASAVVATAWSRAYETQYYNFFDVKADRANASTLYAASSEGVWKSVDAGRTWTPLPDLVNGLDIRAVGANGSTVIAVSRDERIFRSTTSGATWSLVASSVSGREVGEYQKSLLNDPLTANTWYAGDLNTTASGVVKSYVVKSVDGGATWTQGGTFSGGSDIRAYALGADPTTANVVYASGTGVPVAKSIDGSTWNDVSPRSGFFYSLAVPATDTVYTCGVDPSANPVGVYKSTTGGTSWTQMNTGLPTPLPHLTSLFVDPTNANLVFAGGSDGYFFSTNGATSWSAGPGGTYPSSSLPINAMTMTGSRTLVAATSAGIFVLPQAGGPTLSQINPPSGTASGGTVVTLTGTNFVAASGLRVLLGGSDAVVNLGASTSTSIQATTPAHTAGVVDVAAINPDGQSAVLPAAFTFIAMPAPTVSSINPASGNVAGGTSVTISGTNFQSGATVTFGGVAATNVAFVNSATITATTPAHAAGAVDVVVHNPDGQTGTKTSGFTYSTALAAPANVVAAASSTTQVNITWNAVDGATSYQVYRRSPTTGGAFALINSPATNAYADTGVTAGKSYFYIVRAVNASTSSPDSTPDLATTILFTDDPIVAGSTIVKAVHLGEIRNAANAVRALAGLAAASFTGAASAGTTITAAQINEVRTALDGGMSPLGLLTAGYTDTLTAGVPIKAVHFQEIRNRVK